ncbi:pectinesterase [Ananas comosus]|uniref:Pectinesterase n=1 Tax=Ananas comosus TaxID=4615 RepID=A0A6P5GX63_ANACO|nr:pectinesterase [Ananas comosus]
MGPEVEASGPLRPEAHDRRLAWADCVRLYEDSEERIGRLVMTMATGREYDASDATTWISGAMTAHATCVEGLLLQRRNTSFLPPPPPPPPPPQQQLRDVLKKALYLHVTGTQKEMHGPSDRKPTADNAGLLAARNASMSRSDADMVVAQDGSGNYKTIGEAVDALRGWRRRRGNDRVVVYVKSGTYKENVEIDRHMKNVMFIGDGIDRTVVTGDRNVPDGYTTFSSATFGVSGDGFWARDMTFENSAGPEKHQAVALMVASDRAAFYRCSFRGYQDTLFVHSQRQFYRECHVYGTVDFVFGNAAAVLQDCDIYVRKPMPRQSNVITAQGRDDPSQNTGISIHACRVRPAGDFTAVKGSYKSYLGRPWKEFSRTVVMKTDIDGLVHPEGWARWEGEFAIGTLYYAEYMNTGDGASTEMRVKWPGFHVLQQASDAAPFSVERFIDGKLWIPESGVPFWLGV